MSKKIKQFGINVFITFDQTVNVILGGDPDETISSRIGKLKRKNGGKLPWYRFLSRITNWSIEKIDPGHFERAIEDDEGKDAICDIDKNDKV